MAKRFAVGGLALLLVVCGAVALPSKAAPPAAPSKGAEKPAVTVVLPSGEEFYGDLKLLFDLAKDQEGYKTLIDTIDTFLVGVDKTKTSAVRVYLTGDKADFVISAPVRNDADFKKFEENIWDLDLKTAPPPTPAQLPQVPKDVLERQKSLHLSAQERVIFGLYDAFLSHADGHVHMGSRLEDVRAAAQEKVPTERGKGESLTVRIDGQAEGAKDRHKAFQGTRHDLLEKVERAEGETEADFALKRAYAEYQLDKLELLFAEASKAHLAWTTSHEKKTGRLQASVTGAEGSALAQSITAAGKSPDQFGGISAQQCVSAGSFNAPIAAPLKDPLTALSKRAREVFKAKVDRKGAAEGEQALQLDLIDLLFDGVDEVNATGLLNGFMRTWANDGNLTSVGAVQVRDGSRFSQRLQELARRNGKNVQLKVEKQGSVEIHKATLTGQKDYPELIGADGAIFIGTSDKALWYAVGEGALERLKQAIGEAKSRESGSGSIAEVSIHLRPLVEVWEKIDARQAKNDGKERPERTAKTNKSDKAKNDKKDKSAEASKEKGDLAKRAKSAVSDLDLLHVALKAFADGQDMIKLSATRKGDQMDVDLGLEEGVLRFVGMGLSRFVKDNLAD